MSAPAAEPPEAVTHWNLPLWTLGGKQFWTDWLNFHDYRIQKNAMTGHYRLLSPSNTRLAWGNWTGCREALARTATRQHLPAMDGHVIIVLHGLSRTRSSMKSLARHLEQETGARVVNFSYASGRFGIGQHAEALDSVIRNLPEADQISFVGHSMGNIIVRYYLGTSGHDPRFRRMVMLAPPNHGSQLAEWLQKNLMFRTVTGESGQQLAGRWEETAQHLATPGFEFAIIAGSPGEDGRFTNPLIDGEDDLVVSVEETRLAGARDFWRGDFWHSTMMNKPAVQQAVSRFINDGYLLAPDHRQPIDSDLASGSGGDPKTAEANSGDGKR